MKNFKILSALAFLCTSTQAFCGWSPWFQDQAVSLKSAQTHVNYGGADYYTAKDDVTGAAKVYSNGNWINLGGICTSAVSIANYGKGISIFCRGTNGALFSRASTDGSYWHAWHTLDGIITSAPFVENQGYGYAKICATGTDNVTWCRTVNL